MKCNAEIYYEIHYKDDSMSVKQGDISVDWHTTGFGFRACSNNAKYELAFVPPDIKQLVIVQICGTHKNKLIRDLKECNIKYTLNELI